MSSYSYFADDDNVMTVTDQSWWIDDHRLNPKTASLPNSFTNCSVPKTTQNPHSALS